MKMNDHTDTGFPFIQYDPKGTPRTWGQIHGEMYRLAIHELAQIRRELMALANPKLSGSTLSRLAQLQWSETQKLSPLVCEELQGISQGANLPIEDVVVLNNYTDFRDIDLVDEGCSTIYIHNGKEVLAGQTWDMHASAKNYVCVLSIPAYSDRPPSIGFSLVGCSGLMGYVPAKDSNSLNMIGVNNINTHKARAGVIWPVLIREVLTQRTHSNMEKTLLTARVTSGHNYLLGSTERGEMWEVSPDATQSAGWLATSQGSGLLYHTNHCTTPRVKAVEKEAELNSTTFIRENLLDRKIHARMNFDDVFSLLTDHEGYPKSICSHFQSDQKDPSQTCGGALSDLKTGRIKFWRGCPEYDPNFTTHEIKWNPTKGTFARY